MHTIRRIAAVTLVAALTSVGLLPTEPATAKTPAFVDVNDPTSFEFRKTCFTESSCNQITDGVLRFSINIRNRPKPNHPIDLSWELVDVSATAGADYTSPTSGTITFAAQQTFAPLNLPLVNDGVSEPTETVQLHITSISERVDISDVGVGTILDGSQIPTDCSLAWIDDSERSLTCGERPAGQDWHLSVLCFTSSGIITVAVGNTVTGNGTSNARCVGGFAMDTSFVLES